MGTDWTQVTMQIDNGSEVNCLRKQDLMMIDDKAPIKATTTTLRAYGDAKIYPLGKIDVMVKINDRQKQAEFIVVEDAATSHLSGQLSEDFGLLTVNKALLVNRVTQQQPLSREEIITKYKDDFEGLGNIGNYTIELSEDAKPSQDAPCTVLVALHDKLKQCILENWKQMVSLRKSLSQQIGLALRCT